MDEDPEIQGGRDERTRQRAEKRQQMAAAHEVERSRNLHDPEQQHYFAAAGTSLGVLGSGERLLYLLMLLSIGTVLVSAGLDALFHWSSQPGLVEPWNPIQYYGSRIWPLVLCYLIAGLALFVTGRVAAARAGRRELTWLRSLPFRVDGQLDAFGRSTWHPELSVTLSFVEEPMPKAELARLLDAFFPGVSIKAWSDELEFKVMHAGRLGFFSRLFATRGGTSSTLPGRQYTSNRALLLLFHDLVAGVLLPLHRTHPIAAVKLDS